MLVRLANGNMQKAAEYTDPDRVRPGLRAIRGDGDRNVPVGKFTQIMRSIAGYTDLQHRRSLMGRFYVLWDVSPSSESDVLTAVITVLRQHVPTVRKRGPAAHVGVLNPAGRWDSVGSSEEQRPLPGSVGAAENRGLRCVLVGRAGVRGAVPQHL